MTLLYEIYRQSGLAFPYRKYVTALVVAPVVAGVASGAVSAVLIRDVVGAVLGAAVALLVFAALLLYPINQVVARRSHFDNNFVYTLGVLLPLLSAGVPLGRAVVRLAEIEDDRYIARELALVAREIIVMGSSPEEALANSASRVPSLPYRETVEVLVKASRITQRVDLALLSRLDWLLKMKQLKAQSLVRTLTLLFEVFVVVVLLIPLLVHIVALAFSPLGALEVGGVQLDPVTLMYIMALVYTPILGAVFYIVFDSVAKI